MTPFRQGSECIEHFFCFYDSSIVEMKEKSSTVIFFLIPLDLPASRTRTFLCREIVQGRTAMERRSHAYLDFGTLDDTGPLAVVRDQQCRRRAVWLRLWLRGVPHPVSTATRRHQAPRRCSQRTAHAAVRHVGRCRGDACSNRAGRMPALSLALVMILRD